MNNILVIYDENELYGKKLVEWLNKRQRLPWKLACFTNWDSLVRYSKDQYISILLVNESALKYNLDELKSGKVILLQERESREIKNFHTIFKYQSADKIFGELFRYGNILVEKQELNETVIMENVQLIGIYTPQDNWVRTPFSFLLSLILGEKKLVLFVNLDMFSGFEYVLEVNFIYDFIDAISFYQKGTLVEKLPDIMQRIKTIDFIPAIHNPEDIIQLSAEKVFAMLTEICNFRQYDTVVLDIGNCILTPWEYLKFCDKIYVPVMDEGYALAKLTALETYLSAKGLDFLTERIEKINIPNLAQCKSIGTTYIGEVFWGALGDFIKTNVNL